MVWSSIVLYFEVSEPTKRQLNEFHKRFSGNKTEMLRYLDALCTDKKLSELAMMFGVTSNRVYTDRKWFTQRNVKKSVIKFLEKNK